MARIYRKPFDREDQVNRWGRRMFSGALLGHSESAAPVILDKPAHISTRDQLSGGGDSFVEGPLVVDIYTPADMDPVFTNPTFNTVTWTKPAGAVFVTFIAIAGGAGGNAGGRINSTDNFIGLGRVHGGTGGQGGGMVVMGMYAPIVPASLWVTIASGGAGESGMTTNPGNENGGSGGGVPSLDSRIRIVTGSGATFPEIVATGGVPTIGGTSNAPFVFNGGNGAPGQDFAVKLTPDGDGGGGGGSVNGVSPSVATPGSVAFQTVFGGTVAGGTVPGGNGSGFVFRGWSPNGGGSGGGGSQVGNGGNGGDGGYPGGGGGGGGACWSPNTSGAGGNGADGVVIILTNF